MKENRTRKRIISVAVILIISIFIMSGMTISAADPVNVIKDIEFIAGTNVKVNSQHSTQIAVNAFNYDSSTIVLNPPADPAVSPYPSLVATDVNWRVGGTIATLYPTDPTDYSVAWIAVDLGEEIEIASISFTVPIDLDRMTKGVLKGYEVYYETAAAPFDGLVTASGKNTYRPQDNAWKKAGETDIPASASVSDSNFTSPSKFSSDAEINKWMTDVNIPFTPVKARYVLVLITSVPTRDAVLNTSGGWGGFGNFQIFNYVPVIEEVLVVEDIPASEATAAPETTAKPTTSSDTPNTAPQTGDSTIIFIGIAALAITVAFAVTRKRLCK